MALNNLISVGNYDELSALGARYLKTKEFVKDGQNRKIEYMVYQSETKLIIWKKFDDSEYYKLHTEAEVRKRHF